MSRTLICPICGINECEPGQFCVDCQAPEGVIEELEALIADSKKPAPKGVRPEVYKIGNQLAVMTSAARITHIFREATR